MQNHEERVNHFVDWLAGLRPGQQMPDCKGVADMTPEAAKVLDGARTSNEWSMTVIGICPCVQGSKQCMPLGDATETDKSVSVQSREDYCIFCPLFITGRMFLPGLISEFRATVESIERYGNLLHGIPHQIDDLVFTVIENARAAVARLLQLAAIIDRCQPNHQGSFGILAKLHNLFAPGARPDVLNVGEGAFTVRLIEWIRVSGSKAVFEQLNDLWIETHLSAVEAPESK